MEENFDKLIISSCNSNDNESTLVIIFLGGFVAAFFYFAVEFHLNILFIPGFLIGIIAFLFYRKRAGMFKNGDFWLSMIKDNPENIVWIKPIVTKHTIGYVIPLYDTRQFQILTKDGLETLIKSDTKDEAIVFFKGLMNYVPHAQIGYSRAINQIYKNNRIGFIESLKEKGLYTPVNSIEIR